MEKKNSNKKYKILWLYNAYRKTLRGATVGWGRMRSVVLDPNASELKFKKIKHCISGMAVVDDGSHEKS